MSYQRGSTPNSADGIPGFLRKELEKIQQAFAGLSSSSSSATWGTLSGIPANITAFSALTGAADEVPYFTGLATLALASLTPYARTVLACASASAARTALGLGLLAVLNDVDESDITLSDVTTNNVTIARHGFAPKAPNDTTKFLRGDGTWAVPAGGGGVPSYPFTPADGLLVRYNASLSAKDLTALGYVKKWYDISGNGRDTATNVTNPPKWTDSGFLGKYPALYFDFSMKLMIASMPALASPLAATIVFVLMNAESSGNSQIYNYSGNPIGFGSSTPLDFMFNGTLPAAHPMSSESSAHTPTGILSRFPAVGIHVYNGAASVQSINNNEVTVSPGITATGATNLFTIGSDSSSGIGGGTAQTCRMLLSEIAVLNVALDSTQRAALRTYYQSFYGLSYQ